MTNVLRSFFIRSAVMLWALAGALPASAQQSPGIIGEVRVHGNHTTPDADVLAIVGNVVGQPATDALIADVEAKLTRSNRFDGVEVRKRFRSIADPNDVLLMIVVDEVAGVDPLDLTPGPAKRFWRSGMFAPILHAEDGYGVTYGARLSFVDRFGPRSRVSLPFTLGGERQARLQLERTFQAGPINRVAGEVGVGRRLNPHYDVSDRRETAAARIESAPLRWLRFGAAAKRDNVHFGDLVSSTGVTRAGGDVTLDTRVDPAFPRNAVHAVVGLDRLQFSTGHAIQRHADLRGYVGLFGQSVLAVRGVSVITDAPLPPFEQNLLGGAANLRGYRAGYKAGDNLLATSLELRVPLTSPLSVGRFGVKALVDWGTVYSAGESIQDQRLVDRGIGGGAYLQLTLLSVSLDVARSRQGDVRYAFGMGVTFK